MASPPESTTRLRQIVTPVLIMVLAMWLLEVIDVLLRGALDGYGIESRTLGGLFGVAASPLLHGGFSHLIANTVPFVVLGILVAWRSNGRIWPVTITIAILGGLGVWLLGPTNVVTIGASGLVFGFFAFLVTTAILTRHWLDLLVAVAVFLLYGGLMWGVLPFTVGPEVSWLAHLMGAIAGVVAAFAYSDRRRPRELTAPASTVT